MKNPFKGTIIAVPLTRAEPYWRLAKLDVPAMFLDLTKEEARYAAHAIKYYEKLVAMLGDLEWSYLEAESGDNCRCPVCGACEWSDKRHYSHCKLAALLAEVKA